MPDPHRTYEIRCPVYGFVTISDWEREIISQPAFQRLRRIRQLAWTDYVYPGAMHTRFEHSLGVMHMATLLYRGVAERSEDILRSELGYNRDGLRRHEVLVRLAALLHDVGHSPFSHAAEDVFPPISDDVPDKRYRHEQYSSMVVRECFSEVISGHPLNRNCGFTANDVANLLEGNPEAEQATFWRELIDGQMDADRMDYLLRDSHHAGVDYGRYDWRRLTNTVSACPGTGELGGGPRIGVSEGGWHAAEGLILARYFMFTQVYFHKTRVILDYHLQRALGEMLPSGHFARPVGDELQDYLTWDDWKVLGLLSSKQGGEHGRRLTERDHFKEITKTSESPKAEDREKLDQWREALGDLLKAEIAAEKSWYKVGPTDIPVLTEERSPKVILLSELSSTVRNIDPVHQIRLYVRGEDRDEAERKLNTIGGG
jgi:HD superfamily phosphohydrolase